MRQDPEDPSPWRRLLGWLPGGPRSRRTPPPEQQGLRVAAILDDFSATSFRPEADLLLLSPENWAAELAAHRPELVLVESAWRGRDGQWAGKIAGNGTELGGILAWANAMGVPTVFWNKEDPVHFWTFLATTRGFDHVFTTDLDCIARYKSALGHGRVHLLPFACQPQLHNPLELYPRRKAMSFAGAYYRRFPARMRVLESFVGSLPELCPIEIFDRNFGEDGPWKFPPEYESLIVGTLPPERIDLAYKGYRYTLNLNSVQSSPTMFARRVYETLACNTLTASNYSRGLRLMFGDMVPNADDGPALLARLRAVAAQPSREARLRLMALRKVMREHTCRDRLDFIRARTLSPDAPPVWRPPQVVALAEARDSATAARIAASFLAQSHTESRLILVADDPAWGPAHPRIETHARGSLGRLHLQDLVGPRDWLACLSTFDHYGPHYLTDLILATRYSRASLIGKAAHFRWDADGPIHVDA
ncbi:glycosyltransferase, partial [Amaricoccus sp.]|uniref:CgeB family protein n=1 Tax=Amaricoccus sp. TaxID=1872485 RepID=UPI002621FBFB